MDKKTYNKMWFDLTRKISKEMTLNKTQRLTYHILRTLIESISRQ